MKASNVARALDPLANVIGELPVAGSALVALLKVAVEVCNLVQEVQQNKRGLQSLAVQEALLCVSIAKALHAMTYPELREQLQPILNLSEVLADTRTHIVKLRDKYKLAPGGGTVARLAWKSRMRLWMTVNAGDDGRERQELEVRVSDAVKLFHKQVEADIEQLKQLGNPKALTEHILVVASDIRGAILAVKEAEKRTNDLRWLDGTLKRVDWVPSKKSATFHATCDEDTRVDLRKGIDDWATSKDSQRVLWISGQAGTGKSTLARSIQDSLDKEGRLLASFFFSCASTVGRSPEALLYTLAFRFAERFPVFLAAICQTLTEHPEMTNESVKNQFKKLLLTPLKKLVSTLDAEPLVIVVDAFDECELRDGCEGGNLLPLLLDAVHTSPIPLRLFLTSRAEKTIVDVFAGHKSHDVIELHDIPKDVVNGDIRVYFRRRFREIMVERGWQGLGNWPSEAEVDLLVEMAGGLFVYATTVTRFVDHPTIDPTERLKAILRSRTHSRLSPHPSSSPFHLLDIVYTQILEHAIGDEPEDNEYAVTNVRTVVRTLALLQDPLSLSALPCLISTNSAEQATTVAVVQRLGAVLQVTHGAPEPVRLLHSSFPDFILHRCQDSRFLIVNADHHGNLALRCLAVMNDRLRQNICGIDEPTTQNRDVADLAQRANNALTEQLRYACRHWPTHLVLSSPNPALIKELAVFASRHILHWMEALSVMGSLRAAVVGLSSIRYWLIKYADDTTQTLLHDADRMVQANYDLISSAALQVYQPAVIFMPDCALYRRAAAESPSHIRLLSPRPRGWSALLKELVGHRRDVTSMMFMADNVHLITNSRDGSVRLWNSRTAECVTTFAGYHTQVHAIACSPDEKILATCGYPKRVILWNVDTGTFLRALEGRVHTQRCIAFSRDGVHVIAGSDDKAVRIWDVETGNMVRTLEGNTHRIRSVALSPDGRRVVSASHENTINIWDIATGTLLFDLEGHNDWVRSVVFSPDGALVVSGSDDQSIGIWDAETGERRHSIQGHTDNILSVKWTPSGTHVFSSSLDGTIRKWDAHTGACSTIYRIPCPDIFAAAISEDETRIASATSTGNTVRVWDVRTLLEESSEPEGHSSSVTSIAFAPDGKAFASASRDKTVRIWSIESGKTIHTIPHDREAYAVSFSPDGAVLATGSNSSRIRFFKTSSWEELGYLFWLHDGNIPVVSSLTFSGDGSRIACVYHGVVDVWDVARREHIASLNPSDASISSLAFSPDMTRVAMGREKNTPTEVWDVVTAQRVATLAEHRPNLYSLAFTPDGARVISRCFDGKVFVDPLSLETQDRSSEADIAINEAPLRFSWQPGFSGEGRSWLHYSSGAGADSRPMCWLPIERRPNDWWGCCYAWHGNIVVVGSGTGVVMILDLSSAIAAL